MVVPPQPNKFPIEISDLPDNLALNLCVELTRKIPIFFPTLLSWLALSRAVVKTVVLFVAEYGSTA